MHFYLFFLVLGVPQFLLDIEQANCYECRMTFVVSNQGPGVSRRGGRFLRAELGYKVPPWKITALVLSCGR